MPQGTYQRLSSTQRGRRDATIIAMARDGTPLDDLAAFGRVTTGAVRAILHRADVAIARTSKARKFRTVKALTEHDQQRIRKMARDGVMIAEIARRIDRRHSTVDSFMRREGLIPTVRPVTVRLGSAPDPDPRVKPIPEAAGPSEDAMTFQKLGTRTLEMMSVPAVAPGGPITRGKIEERPPINGTAPWTRKEQLQRAMDDLSKSAPPADREAQRPTLPPVIPTDILAEIGILDGRIERLVRRRNALDMILRGAHMLADLGDTD